MSDTPPPPPHPRQNDLKEQMDNEHPLAGGQHFWGVHMLHYMVLCPSPEVEDLHKMKNVLAVCQQLPCTVEKTLGEAKLRETHCYSRGPTAPFM